MKPPRKNQYKGKPGGGKSNKRKGNRIKTGPGILDRVKSAFNKKQSSSTVKPSLNSTSTTTTTTTPPTNNDKFKAEFEAKYGDGVSKILATGSPTGNPAPVVNTPPSIMDKSGNTTPSGATILDSIADGSATFSNVQGNYNPSKGGDNNEFTADSSGGNFSQLNTASGIAGNVNQFRGTTTKGDNSAFKPASAYKENFTKDFLGNNKSTYSGVLNKLANKAGIDPNTKEYQEYISKARGDINKLENARKVYDRNYNYADHLGTVGPDGNIPSGFNFGEGDANDLAMLDSEGGGLGTAYTRINNQSISRMGRYVNANKGIPGSVENLKWENQNVGSSDNLKDNPYQQHYWTNPEARSKAPSKGGITSTVKGVSYEDMSPADKDGLNKTIETNQKTQFYNSDLYRQIESDYGDLSYDYDNSDAPWTMKNEAGESTGNMAFHSKELK